MFHEAAVSKNKPGFCDRRMDREERITFMKYLIKFCSKRERNNFSKCKQYSRKTFSDWKLLALHKKNVKQHHQSTLLVPS